MMPSTVAAASSHTTRATSSTAVPSRDDDESRSLWLSTAAKVGVSVGAALGGLTVIVLVSVCLSRRRKRRRKESMRRNLLIRDTAQSATKKKSSYPEKKRVQASQRELVELPSDPPPRRPGLGYLEAGPTPTSPEYESNWI